MDDYDALVPTGGSLSREPRHNPSVRAAVIMWTLLTAVTLFHAATGGASLVLCFPLQIPLYMATGALAGFFASKSGYAVTNLPKYGALAGAISWLLPAVIALI